MRIDTMTTGLAVHASPTGETVELRIGEPGEARSCVANLSIAQAEMLLHALGFGIAQIREQQRLSMEDRQRLAQVVADTEVRLR